LAPVIGAGSLANPAELKVVGTATITGGYLAPTFAPGFLAAGKYLVFSAGSLTGTGFVQQSVTVPSIGLTSQILQSGNQYYVVLTQLPTLPGYDRPSIIPVLSSAAIDEAQQATGVLLDRLAGLRANAVADEMSVALTELHRVRSSSPYGLWVQPLGNFGSVSGNNGVAGYDVLGGGLMAGIDTEWSPGVVIGGAVGYSNNFVKQSDNASGTISVPRMAAYGGWWRGPFAVDAVIGVGMGQIDGSRPVLVPSMAQTAYSNHAANEKAAALQGSANFAFDGWVIAPALGVKYLNLRETSFTETGTNLYNFTVASGNINSLRPFANLLLTKRFMIGDHWALVPELKVGLEHELDNSLHSITAQTEGDAYNWYYSGLLPGADLLRVDGGVKLETSRAAAFFVDYNHLQSSTTTNDYISGGFRYRL
jgi:outer membrane autotransporter protein